MLSYLMDRSCHSHTTTQVGRYVVAARDIDALEVILEDSPAVFGPNNNTPPVCLECLKR